MELGLEGLMSEVFCRSGQMCIKKNRITLDFRLRFRPANTVYGIDQGRAFKPKKPVEVFLSLNILKTEIA